MKIKLKIRRCDPTVGDGCEPFLQAYDVEAAEGMTVLEALVGVVSKDDPTLAFRRSCRSAICGSCAVMVNGFPKLACNTQVIPEFKKHGEMLLEPLTNHSVLKDLIVDSGPFWGKIDKVTPFLTPQQEGEALGEATGESAATGAMAISPVVSKEDEQVIDDAQKCVMCGACNAACNTQEIESRYVGPSASAKAWRFVGDVREGRSEKRLERLSLEHGIWDCVRCAHCTEYCPKGVKPLEAIERLRSRAIKEGVVDNHGAKHAIAMAESIKRVGRLDEAAMTFKTLGFLRSIGMIPMGIKMEFHGKMPHPILFPAIDGIAEVRSIYEAREKALDIEKKDRRKKDRRKD